MRIGSIMTVIVFLAGVWVAIMPRLVGFEPTSGNPWTAATLASVVLGGGIALAALVGLVGFYGLQLKERERVLRHAAERRARERARAAEASAQPAAGPRVLPEARPDGVRKLSRVERTQNGAANTATPRLAEDINSDVALRQLAQSILQDLQRGSGH